jgi:DNA-binding SARP family transcriptional activator
MMLRFGVLGPLQVKADGSAVAVPRSAVLRGLLGALLLAQGRPVPVPGLLALVWADGADRVGRGAVHTGVSRLRDWLARFEDDVVAVEFDGGGYRLGVPHEAIDLGRFRDLAAAGQWSAAVALRRGPVLAGQPRLDRADPLVGSVEEEVRQAVLSLADTALASGTPRCGIPALTALAEESPLDEPVRARLMKLLAADGRPAQALRHFHTLRRQLADELGIEPGEQAQQVFLTLLARDSQIPATAQTGAPSAQLPRDIGDFTGRQEQVKLVRLALGRGEIPVIAGMGGIGKTALAVHTAHRLAASFPDGQLYADLRGGEPEPENPGVLLGRFLRALGIDTPVLPESLHERSALYRSTLAGRRILVVLDNAAGHQQVRHLLPGTGPVGTPGPAVVITSRARLTGLAAARLIDLDVLDPAHQEASEPLHTESDSP